MKVRFYGKIAVVIDELQKVKLDSQSLASLCIGGGGETSLQFNKSIFNNQSIKHEYTQAPVKNESILKSCQS